MADALPIKALHHLAVTTKRLEESIDFYTKVLGFRQLERPNFGFRGSWLYGIGIQIHIIERVDIAPDPSAEDIDTRALHMALAVEDTDVFAQVEKQLDDAGIAFVKQVNAGGIPQLFFQDPDGHHIEIGVYPPTPPFID
ncbi:MAG: VOC family protein [Pirellulales bacterium]|nr:VOC family protein [Pirellulales bacterium]